jgi:hypothetical protein
MQQTPARRRSSVSEASGPDRAEATRRLQEVSDPPSRALHCRPHEYFKSGHAWGLQQRLLNKSCVLRATACSLAHFMA